MGIYDKCFDKCKTRVIKCILISNSNVQNLIFVEKAFIVLLVNVPLFFLVLYEIDQQLKWVIVWFSHSFKALWLHTHKKYSWCFL